MLSTLRQGLVRLGPVLRPAWRHLFWPWRCPLCDGEQVPAVERIVCPACHERLLAGRTAGYCPGCGREMDGASGDRRTVASAARIERCPACRRQPLALEAVGIGGRYRDLLREAIVQWKFHRSARLEPMLTDLLAEALRAQPWSDDVEALVPIGQPWMRWVRRGLFWPAGQLAEGLARRTGLPVWPVLRARWHRPQVGLRRGRRMENARGVFIVQAGIDLQGKRVCLVDDVMTTGATLHNAAKALQRGGAGSVYGLVVAKALG